MSKTRIGFVLAIGLLAVSLAAILIRWCQAPSFTIAAYRLGIASILLLLFRPGRFREALRTLDGRGWQLGILSGVCLGIHFAAWITSLELTSIANSVVFVTTSPFFVALGSWLILGTSIKRLFLIGLAIAFCGMVIISAQDFGRGSSSLGGDLLALLGAASIAGYIMCGRVLRARVDTAAYVTLAYTIAAIFMLLVVFVTQTPMAGFSSQTYLLLVLIAIVPQLIGHTSFNWSLRYLSAPLVSTIFLGEPVFATFFAYLLLNEVPSIAQLAGSALILGGVGAAIWSERVPKATLAMAEPAQRSGPG